MNLRIGGLFESLRQVAENRLGSREERTLVGNKDGNAIRAGCLSQLGPLIPLCRHLSRDVVDPELGQPLAHLMGVWAPLGLVQRQHERANLSGARPVGVGGRTGAAARLQSRVAAS